MPQPELDDEYKKALTKEVASHVNKVAKVAEKLKPLIQKRDKLADAKKPSADDKKQLIAIHKDIKDQLADLNKINQKGLDDALKKAGTTLDKDKLKQGFDEKETSKIEEIIAGLLKGSVEQTVKKFGDCELKAHLDLDGVKPSGGGVTLEIKF